MQRADRLKTDVSDQLKREVCLPGIGFQSLFEG